MNDPAPPVPRWQAWWARYHHVVAVFSFLAGAASFALIERQEKVAQILVILLPLSWLLVLLDPWLQQLAERRRLLRGSPLLLSWLTQGLHQESFFFTLPFFFATTTWASPQALFIGVLMLLALGSMIDPFYFRWVQARRWALWGFHAAAGFITVLTAAPMLWHLTTLQALQLASVCAAVLSVPAWAAALQRLGAIRWPLALLAGLAVGIGILQLRVAVPPATLWVGSSAITLQVDVSTRMPGPALKVISSGELGVDGLYAWTAIRAPRGLTEHVEHHWWFNGKKMDEIRLDIRGGREQGYRAWTHKLSFPADPRGDWEVRVVTEGGQLLGVQRFQVR